MNRFLLISIALILSLSAFSQVEIYNENFDAGLPVSYTIVDNDGFTPDAVVSEYVNAWIELVDPDSTDIIVGSTSFFDPVGQADRWLITPPITLGAYGNVAYWEAKSHDPSHPDDYMVLVSTTDTQLSSFTDTLVTIYQESAIWNSRIAYIDSASSTLGQTVHLAFVNRTNDGFKLYLDNIRVEKEDASGIVELDKGKIHIYPNPSNEDIYISGIEDITSIKIVSLSGQELIETTENKVDISHLNPGRYIVIAKNQNTIARSSVIKL